jgi:CheY-like chemotaxis protein
MYQDFGRYGLKPSKSASPLPLQRRGLPRTPSIKVLVVDDDRAIRDVARLVLEDAGYTVMEAANGVAALHLLRSHQQPLVVLLDDLMPELDGLGVLRAAAADLCIAHRCSFILMTGSARLLSPALAPELGPLRVQLLPKPFDADVLLDRVEQGQQVLAS